MASPILGPVTRVPYEVLTEIFVHCLPQRRLQHRQPNTTIAPILLCHVCSTWRTVAFETATLWTHLSFRLSVAERNRLEDGIWIVCKNQYAFLLWWKNNQRSTAPSICLDLRWNYLRNSETVISEPILDSELELDRVGMISLFEYISSAKYIEIDETYWLIVRHLIQRGYPIAYPVPHTLAVSQWLECFDFFYQDQVALVPNHSPSPLRHLYLHGDIHLFTLEIPAHWSSLTHLSLLVLEMSLDYWYTLIRAVPQLQMGHFDICDRVDTADYTEPTPCTLAQLSTLSISIDVMWLNSVLEFPLAMLLTALHLPALRDLSLSSTEAWGNRRALGHISAVLDVVPGITTLTLGPSFLDLRNDYEYFVRMGVPRLKSAEPIWRRAPHLAHLRIVAEDIDIEFQMDAEERRDAFVRNLFHRENRWLDLHNAACPIQSITIIDQQPWRPLADRIADHTRSRIQEYAGGSPNVKAVFDIIFETEDQAIAGAWNEWGPNLQ